MGQMTILFATAISQIIIGMGFLLSPFRSTSGSMRFYIKFFTSYGPQIDTIFKYYRDLNMFMEKYDLMNRTHLIQAGATSRCNSSTIKMKRPDYEEKVCEQYMK